MAIVNQNGVIAGLQPPAQNARTTTTQVGNRPVDLWNGSFDTTLNGVVLSSSSGAVGGQFYHLDPPGGVNAYLARFEANSNVASGVVMLCDRLWHNGGITITSTSAQTIVSPTWPARDNNGTTNGDGVLVALEVSATTGAGAPTGTLSYTNSAGTAGRTATLAEATAGSTVTGALFRFGLQAGDAGVQSIQSFTLGASWTSGTCNLVAYRVLAVVDIMTLGLPGAIDAVSGGFPQIFNGAVPFSILVSSNLLASTILMVYQETQG